MSEIASDFSASFNQEFCGHLEFHLCRTFENADREELSGFWCDGVSWAPFFNPHVNRAHLAIDKVLAEKKIVTKAKLGKSGQDNYEMTLVLGQNALHAYKNGLSLIDCLPAEESMDWIDMDATNRKIALFLK
ncbi:MAG TPA: hypothetical protein VK177_04135 [Flavobacteriales bacterium]|nr:hypothetical protein [Flavobacteriales bacterium]